MSDFIIPVNLKEVFGNDEIEKELHIEINKTIRNTVGESQLKAKRDSCYFCHKSCKGFCNSHTVPAFCLKNIAKGGMVLSNNSLLRLPGIKEKKGINEAATFHLICRECDSKIFQEYENEDNYSQIPTTKMLAEIAMKNCLRTIGKRELEAQIYNALEMRFNLPQQISNGHQDIIKLDLREEELSFKKAKRTYNKPFDNDYYIGIYIELPYKVPIAYQGEVALWCDLEGNKINDLFNKSDKYWIKNINVAVFPLKEKSIVLVFVEKDNKRYGNFFKQIKKMPLDKQLQVINYIIFACTEDYFLSPYLSTDTMELLEDVAGMTSEMINLSGEYNEYESAETAIGYYSFDKMNEIPNILSNEYQIKNIAE